MKSDKRVESVEKTVKMFEPEAKIKKANDSEAVRNLSGGNSGQQTVRNFTN